MFTALRISTTMVAQRAGILKLNVAVFTGISKTVKCDSSHAELRAGILKLNVAVFTGISKTVKCDSSHAELRAGILELNVARLLGFQRRWSAAVLIQNSELAASVRVDCVQTHGERGCGNLDLSSRCAP